MLAEHTVDECRDTLVRVHPVLVPASKHGVLDAGESGVLNILQPLDKVLCVVGRLAFEGGGNNQDRAVLR